MNQNENVFLSVVIAAAGSATRMNGINKQLYKLGKYPVVEHSLRAFLEIPSVQEIFVVCRANEKKLYQKLLTKYSHTNISFQTVLGGDTRQESVFAGIRACSPQTTHFAIHDGARPMIQKNSIKLCLKKALLTKAAAVGVPVTDTIKIVNDEGQIISTPPREFTYAIQTPQIFEATLYRKAMEKAIAEDKNYTDDCQLVEQLGHPVYVSPGDYQNIKLTTPKDIPILHEIFSKQGGPQCE